MLRAIYQKLSLFTFSSCFLYLPLSFLSILALHPPSNIPIRKKKANHHPIFFFVYIFLIVLYPEARFGWQYFDPDVNICRTGHD